MDLLELELEPDRIRIRWLCRWWFRLGLRMGWISDVVCNTHDGLPMSEAEQDEWEEGFDSCVAAVRVWAAS